MSRVLILVAVLVLAACGSGAGEQSPTSAPAARAIEGETLDGTRIALEDYRGKAVVVNVWSSW